MPQILAIRIIERLSTAFIAITRPMKPHPVWNPPSEIPAVLPDVPVEGIRTGEREGNGRHVEWVRYVREGGQRFYLVHMERHDKDDLTMRIDLDGTLLSIERN